MILGALFCWVFVVGPLGFRMLTRRGHDVHRQWLLGVCTVGLALAGLGLRYGFAEVWGQYLGVTLGSIGLIWCAWIGLLAYGAQAMRRADTGPRMRHVTAVVGTAATTLPWFGLISANLVQG